MKVEKKTSIQKWLFFDEATHVPPAYRPKRSVEHKSRPFPPHPSKKSALRGKRKVIYCISHRNTRHRFKNFVFVFCFSLIKIRLLLQKHDQFHWLFQPSLKSWGAEFVLEVEGCSSINKVPSLISPLFRRCLRNKKQGVIWAWGN